VSSTKAGAAARAAVTRFQAKIAAGFLGALIFAAAALVLSPASASAEQLSPDEARAIAKEATIYGFPLVDSYRIQYSYFVDRSDPEYKGPWNTVTSNARVSTPDDKAIQSPNADTPYSFLGADLRAEPLVITVPAIDKDRYYSLQFIDMYTFNFAYVGSRTTGNDAGNFLLAGPDWHGEAPVGVKAVIRSETEFAFVIYRTQLFNPGDIDSVKRIQGGYKVEPLSHFLGKPSTPLAPPLRFITPLSAEEERTSPEFFNVLNFVLGLCPPNALETKMLARFAQLGIGPRKTFDPQALSPEMLQAVQDGMADAWAAFKEFKETQIDTGRRTSADGFGSREYLNDDYLARMSAAALGIYGNSKAEALYPVYFVDEAKRALSGESGYELRFAPGQLPPVNAFWSLTLYELPSSLLSANRLNRYLINSPMLPSLRRDPDGGVTLYIQHVSPGPDKEANWLPAPSGPFYMAMRLYWPKPEARDGRWTAPPLVANSPPPVEAQAPPPIEAKPPAPVEAKAPPPPEAKPPAPVVAQATPQPEAKPPAPVEAKAPPPIEAKPSAPVEAKAPPPVVAQASPPPIESKPPAPVEVKAPPQPEAKPPAPVEAKAPPPVVAQAPPPPAEAKPPAPVEAKAPPAPEAKPPAPVEAEASPPPESKPPAPVEAQAPPPPEAKPPAPVEAKGPPPVVAQAPPPPTEAKPPAPVEAKAQPGTEAKPPAQVAAVPVAPDNAEAKAPAPVAAVPVTPDNFPRAESDLYFGYIVKDGGFGRFTYRREPVAIDKQTIIRMNRDTLYSAAVFDLDAGPVTVTLPHAGKRFMSMQVIDEDEYTPEVDYGAGSHTFTRDRIGTRYVLLGVRMLVDASDPKDVRAVHALQDAIRVDQPGGPGKFETPNWDQASQRAVRDTLLKIASTLPDTKGMFGPRGAVDPAKRLVGAASAWGGNPEKDALYLNVTPMRNDGKTIYKLDVKDVPVDGFWSISVYDAKGRFEPNPLNAYSLNNITAKADEDGSIAVQFGGCDGKVVNCLPTPPDWNYLVRLYRPRPEILNGSWTFPEPQRVD
jgi:hypothetical protein